MKPSFAFAASLLFLSSAGAALAQSVSPAKPVVLVELFTSEGCSSCPPADALLRQIDGTTTRDGQLIVGISEHVTYWNSLGWADPFSAETYTDRQSAYVNRFHLDSAYTPQMVIDGDEQIVGGDRGGLVRAVEKQPRAATVPIHILSATEADGVLNITFSADGPAAAQGADIMAVLADDLDRSNVERGENSGRTLTHVSVARSMTRVATVGGAGSKTVQVPLPASFRGGKGGHHLILFAQTRGLGPVLGIDSKPI